jgi:hypothetical protein
MLVPKNVSMRAIASCSVWCVYNELIRYVTDFSHDQSNYGIIARVSRTRSSILRPRISLPVSRHSIFICRLVLKYTWTNVSIRVDPHSVHSHP